MTETQIKLAEIRTNALYSAGKLPSTDAANLLKDAEKIFKWLSKDLKTKKENAG